MSEGAAVGAPGEQVWLEAALDRYEGALLRYATSVAGRAAAPDIVQAVILKFSGGLRYKEIAEVMELSVSHVGVILHTAIGQLRAQLAGPAQLVSLRGEP